MKNIIKKLFILLTLLSFSFLLISCKNDNGDDKTNQINIEVFDFEVPTFEISFNGTKVNNTLMSGTKVYSSTVTTINTEGKEETFTFTGYLVNDIIAKIGLTGTLSSAVVIAKDGYQTNYENVSKLDNAMLAFNKIKLDGTEEYDYSAQGPWFAPISSTASPDYSKKCDKIFYNGLTGENKEIVTPSDDKENVISKKSLTFDSFTFKVDGNDVTNQDLLSLSTYKATVYIMNKAKTSTFEYNLSGYKLKDVLEVLNIDSTDITFKVGSKEAKVSAEQLASDNTLLIIETQEVIDGVKQERKIDFTFAPCDSDMKSDYLFGFTEIITK